MLTRNQLDHPFLFHSEEYPLDDLTDDHLREVLRTRKDTSPSCDGIRYPDLSLLPDAGL